MGLLDQAAADLVAILSDDVGGFAVSIRVIDPDDNAADIKGLATRIGTSIDPETGQPVAGEKASVALPTALLRTAGLKSPRGVSDDTLLPWRVRVPSWGNMTFKVSTVMPDKLGVIVCFLEAYED